MDINVLVFGQIADITGEHNIIITGVVDTVELIQLFNKKYPSLQSVEYSIAVNKEIVRENMKLKDNDIVALLPPFSGG